MARHDDTNARSLRVDVKFGEVVNDINKNLADLNELGFLQLVGPGALVVISTHGGDRSDRRKLGENACVANVAAMNDEVTAPQKLPRARPNEAMRI